MITYFFEGEPKKFTSEEKKHLHPFVSFCISKLFKEGKRSANRTVEIHFISGLWRREGMMGSLEVLSETTSRGRYTEFLIEVDDSLSARSTLRCIAHELVHVKQYAVGELNFTKNPDITLWKSEKWNEAKETYWEFPWEIEAYGREIGLFYQWSDTIPEKQQKKWMTRRDS